MIGLELEALAVVPKPLEREEWLDKLSSVPGSEVKDPCTGQLVGKRGEGFVLKTDTTSAIIEVSVEPGPEVVSRAFNVLKFLNLRFYDKGYYPVPGLKWYLRNATPRGHYRLLHWYGYQHWRIATMASSQIWLDVDIEALPNALDSINKASPWLLSKYSNSPYAGWAEYRVRAWQLFSESSWASLPYPWAPKGFKSWKDVLWDLLSGKPQEVEPCLDLSLYSWRELSEAFERNEIVARRADMGFGKASREGVLKGMQRWSFRPAIARWKVGEVDPKALRGAIEGDPEPFLNSVEKVMVEVRLLPFLPEERLKEAIEDLKVLLEAEAPEVGDGELRETFVRAARGTRLPSWANWPERV